VIEPSHLFDVWLPTKYRDSGPKPFRQGMGPAQFVNGAFVIKSDPEGRPTDWWRYEGREFPYRRNIAGVGMRREELTLDGITYDEMRPGCYDPKERLADMDLNWVEASVCFPTLPRFCGQTFYEASDKEVALACVRAYNDWMVEEWCGDSGGRLIPLIIIPLWDPVEAACEVRRNAVRGVRAVCFSEMPPYLGLPSIYSGYWDPFFAACDEVGMALLMHIGSSSKMPAGSPEAPPAVSGTLTALNAMTSLSDWLFSEKFIQFPNLKIAYSEANVGWIPYILERADDFWLEHRGWSGTNLPNPPSSYFPDHVWGCFVRDDHGLASLDAIGVDSVTFETDYPHTDTTWPNTKAVAERSMKHLDEDVIYKIVRGNAIRMLDLGLSK